MRLCPALVGFEHKFDRSGWRIAGASSGQAGFRLLDIDDFAIFVHPDHIERDEGVFHPESGYHGGWQHKQHAFVSAQAGAAHQADLTLGSGAGKFGGQGDIVIVGVHEGDDARR